MKRYDYHLMFWVLMLVAVAAYEFSRHQWVIGLYQFIFIAWLIFARAQQATIDLQQKTIYSLMRETWAMDEFKRIIAERKAQS